MKTDLRTYIKIFDGKFYTKQKCKLIINSLDRSKNTVHTFYHSKSNQLETMGEDPQVSFLKDEKLKPIGKFIKDQWYKIVDQYILKFLKKEKMDWYNGWNGYVFPKFMEYNEGTLMQNHCDHIYSLFEDNGKSRGVPVLSLITALNDNYSGGEIIMCGKYEYKLKTGETLIFPSNFLYPHEIKKITKGTRYSMVTWVY